MSKTIDSLKNIPGTIWSVVNNEAKYPRKDQNKIGNRIVDDGIEVLDEFDRFFTTVACEQVSRSTSRQTNATGRQL